MYEAIMVIDLATTIGLEIWAEMRKGETEPMTREQFVEATAALAERRKTAIAAIKNH